GEGVTGGRSGSTLVGGDALTRQYDPSGVLVVLQDGPPGSRDLVGVARADDVESGDSAKRSELLDRLVSRSILAEADRTVRPNIARRDAHESDQPHSGTLIVAELQERTGKRPLAAVHHDAVNDRSGRVLTDPDVHHASIGIAGVQLSLAAL